MKDIALVEKQIQQLKSKVMRDLEVLLRLEQVKHRYYKTLMGRREHYESD